MITKNFLQHEKIDNLVGLEIELVYEWELGSMLIFDRTNLHCSSSKIEGKNRLNDFYEKDRIMAIYDCFQYFNEEHIADLRFNILNEFVDHFVIVESTVNHQGKDKKLQFDINKYKKFKKKLNILLLMTLQKILKNHMKVESL